MTGLPVQSSRWLSDRGPRWLDPLLVGCALALLLGLHAQRYWPLTVDDAAISFTYARNLAAGHGLVLDPGGEPVEAYSNPLWVGLLALLHLFRLPLEPGAKLLGLGFAWGSLLLLPVGATLLVRSRSSRVRRPAPGAEGVTASVSLPLAGAIPDWWLAVTVVTALLVAGTPRFVLWSVAGLESGLHGFLLCALLAVLLFERESERAPYGTALLLLLLLATRPEAPLYWAVVGAAAAIRLLRQLPDQPRAAGRRRGRALLPLLLGGGLLLGLRLWLFDAWLPNSYRIKAASFPFAPGSLFDPQGAGWQYLGTFVLRETLLPHLVILLLGLLPRRGRSSYLLGLGLLGAGFLFPLLAGGDWMPQHRFLAPLLPLLLLLTAASLGRLTLALSRQPLILGQPLLAGRVGWGALLLLAVMGVPRVVQLRSGAPVALSGFTTFATVAERGRAFGSLAGTLQLSRASLLDPDIGGTSFASGLAVHDLFGLADRALPGIRWQPPLVREHLLHELEPTFVHLHGAWLSAYYLHEYPELDTLYLPLPARLAGVELGPGRHYLRRGDLLSPWFPVEPSGRGRFDSLGVQLVHVDLAVAVVVQGTSSSCCCGSWCSVPSSRSRRASAASARGRSRARSASSRPRRPSPWGAGCPSRASGPASNCCSPCGSAFRSRRPRAAMPCRSGCAPPQPASACSPPRPACGCCRRARSTSGRRPGSRRGSGCCRPSGRPSSRPGRTGCAACCRGCGDRMVVRARRSCGRPRRPWLRP